MSSSSAAPQPVNAYNFHGVTIAIAGDLPAARFLGARFQAFPRLVEIERPDLAFEFHGGDPAIPYPAWGPRGPLRPIYDLPVGEVVYSDSRDEIYITYNDSVSVLCDVGRGRVRTSVLGPQAINQRLASHIFFMIPFMELLKRRGLYSLHAAGLSVDGKGLLLPGESGSGKTTLAVALVRAGLDFLGDDMVFLSDGPRGVRVLAFPDELDVAPSAGSLIPALRHLVGSTPPDGMVKHRIRTEDLLVSAHVWECLPKVLVFPQIADTDKSVLTRIDAHEALLELTPNILLTESRACQAHLDILGRLARESACYRLATGRDFDRLPGLLRELLG